MLYKKITILIFLIFSFYFSNAKSLSADSTIKITSAKSYYLFTKNKDNGTVLVKEAKQTHYKNDESTTLPITEFYNDNSKIISLTCKINNKSVRDFKPIDTYYSSKDIFHSDQRLNYFPLNLPAKAITELSLEKTTINPLYFTSIYFTDDYDIIQKEVVLKIPRQLFIEFKELNFEGFNITKTVVYNEKDDSDIITYKMTNIAAEKTENYSPGHSYIYPHLLALSRNINAPNIGSYFNSTQDQYNWYRQLTKDLNEEKDPVIVEQAKNITKELTADVDKIKAIYYWVQDNVRYIAFEDGLAGFKPDKATDVLRKKYGDCKGMANLTKTLIKALGIDARLCWLGTNHIAYNYATPSLAVDNHMICAVKLNEKFIFLDATETYLGFNEYAERIQSRQILIEDDQKYILTNVPTTNVDMNLDFVSKKLKIEGKDLVGKVNHIWKGEHKEILLSDINASKKDKLDQSINNYLSNDNQNYSISNLTFSPLNNYDKDIVANYQLTYKNSADVFNNSYYLSLDNDKEYNNFVVDTAKRKHDLWLPYKANIEKEIELQIPSNYSIAHKPNDLIIKNSHYLFTITYQVLDDKIIYKKNIKFFDPKINKSNFNTWNSDIKKLSQSYSETITLKPKS